MGTEDLETQFRGTDEDRPILDMLRKGETRSSAPHDHEVLAAARATARDIRQRRHGAWITNWLSPLRWPIPATMAASFLLGAVVVSVVLSPPQEVGPDAGLTIPVVPVTRSGDAEPQRLSVEDADPQRWLEYIQELVYNGDLEEAERHIRRFNELHPDFEPGS